MAEAPINPAVLEWAIGESGLSIDSVAAQLTMDPDVLADWASGSARPGVTDLRKLARLLKRPPATFFLPRPPTRSAATPRLRGRPGDSRALSPRERLSLREARRVQLSVREVREDLGEDDVSIPVIRGKSVIDAGILLRRWLGIGAEGPRRLSASEGFRFWREALEARNVLVFLMSLDENGARGFSLTDPAAPLIVASTRYNVHARIFTLFHELAHLASGTESVCQQVLPRQAEKEERRCDEVAAALLMPEGAVRRFLQDDLGWRPGGTLKIDAAGRVASEFCVSLTAAAIRLIELGAANRGMLSALPANTDAKPPGGGGGGASRIELRERTYGWGAIGTLVRGVQEQVATRHEARRYLDITDRELEALEQSS